MGKKTHSMSTTFDDAEFEALAAKAKINRRIHFPSADDFMCSDEEVREACAELMVLDSFDGMQDAMRG